MRYVYRAAAEKLFADGFFSDALTKSGLLALFYEKTIDFYAWVVCNLFSGPLHLLRHTSEDPREIMALSRCGDHLTEPPCRIFTIAF